LTALTRQRLQTASGIEMAQHLGHDKYALSAAAPEWYSDEFGRLLRRAGLWRITLHNSPRTLTRMKHGRADLHHQQVGRALRLGVHPDELRLRDIDDLTAAGRRCTCRRFDPERSICVPDTSRSR
jgi:hypothetical protein